MTDKLLFDDLYAAETTSQAAARRQAEAEAAEGEQLRREGMERAAKSGAGLLGVAREIAFDLQRENGGLCNADQVAEVMAREGYPSLGNAAGSIFTSGNWEWTGEFVKSERAQAHQNLLRQWRWKHGS